MLSETRSRRGSSKWEGCFFPLWKGTIMDIYTVGTTDDEAGPSGRLLLTAEEVADALAICRTKVCELLRNGQLESIRIGSSRRIPRSALAEYVQRLRVEQSCTPRSSFDIA